MNKMRNATRSLAPAESEEGPARGPTGLDARHLLAALAPADAYAFRDPTEDGVLIVRTGTGISLGRGRHAERAGEDLLRAGLVERAAGPQGRLTITAAGRARLRRMEGGPEPYLAQHLDLAVEATPDGPRLTDVSESPIAWMARRRDPAGRPFLDAAAVEAGERLRREIATAQMMPRMSMDWSAARVDGSGPRDPASASDTVLAARQRVDAALDAVGGDLANLLIDLCGYVKGLERIETERRWPARSAKVVARIALDRLAGHYGLESRATGPERSRSRLWRIDA